MKHRSDIDGLRAVAVIPVVLFHAGISQVSGGFVGVDVFFVISGYLITGLILDDMVVGRFSIISFYERRARRILPALLAVLLAALVGTCVLLMPDRAREFGKNLIATVFFSSNVLFWKEAGYFQAHEGNPLLHTWSLAVEEQFYIAYPIFLFTVHRYLRKRYLLALSPVLGLSLAFCIWGVHEHRSMTFFLAPARAWELLLGALLAIPAVPVMRNRLMANILGAFGLVLLAYSFVRLSGASPFPGANALYPTLGAGLIIYSGTASRTLVAKVLSVKPMVFIGLISYSLYLWHWVVLVFLRAYLVRPLVGWEVAAEIAACLLFASLSWKFIEAPFRGRQGRNRISRRWIFAGGAVGSLILAIAGGLLYETQGWPSRFNQQTLELYSGKYDTWKRRDDCANRICFIGKSGVHPSFLLWGDSHAGAIAPVFEQVATANNVSGFVAYKNACAPLLGLMRYDGDSVRQCITFNQSVLAFIDANQIRTVFLHGRWALYSEGSRYKQEDGVPALLTANRNTKENYPVFENLFRSTIEELRRRQINVVIIAGVPEVGVDVPTALARSAIKGHAIERIEPRYFEFVERQARSLEMLSRVAAETSSRVTYPHLALCDNEFCSVVKEKHALYFDDDHLSVHGSMCLLSTIAPWLTQRNLESTPSRADNHSPAQ